jgi:hypothetical protein
MTLGFAFHEGCAVRYNIDEAWECINGTWKPMHPADAWCKASVVTEAVFNSMFLNLPDLPKEAGQAPPASPEIQSLVKQMSDLYGGVKAKLPPSWDVVKAKLPDLP